MFKVTIISQCLINSGHFTSLQEAERRVQQIFEKNFPAKNFNNWNTNTHDETANQITNNIGRAKEINVIQLIRYLE